MSTSTSGDSEPFEFPIEQLKQAIEAYLKIAYGEEPVPSNAMRRLNWPDQIDCASLLRLHFEQLVVSNQGAMFALRLGNCQYPHMKIQIQSFKNREGYLLSVNTHDQIVATPNMEELDRFRELQKANQKFKEAIEKAWRDLGIPTFIAYLEDEIRGRGECQNEDEPPET